MKWTDSELIYLNLLIFNWILLLFWYICYLGQFHPLIKPIHYINYLITLLLKVQIIWICNEIIHLTDSIK